MSSQLSIAKKKDKSSKQRPELRLLSRQKTAQLNMLQWHNRTVFSSSETITIGDRDDLKLKAFKNMLRTLFVLLLFHKTNDALAHLQLHVVISHS